MPPKKWLSEYYFCQFLLDDPELEEFQLEIEESKLQTSVQCTPIPGKWIHSLLASHVFYNGFAKTLNVLLS